MHAQGIEAGSIESASRDYANNHPCSVGYANVSQSIAFSAHPLLVALVLP